MWQKMIRNLEWLLIVALLVGAVMAVGCGEEPPTNPNNPSVTASFASPSIVLGNEGAMFYRTISPSNNPDWRFEVVLTNWPGQPDNKPQLLPSPGGSGYSLFPEQAGSYTVCVHGWYKEQIPPPGINVCDTVVVTDSAQGNLPVANAGPDQNATIGTTVSLNGNMSYHPSNIFIVYFWTLTYRPNGSNATLNNENSVTPSFVPDLDGDYVISLTVGDGMYSSSPDTVTVKASSATPTNTAPIANAGPDQSVINGNDVTLSGAMSTDPENNSLNYVWSFSARPSGSSATLTNANTVSPVFTPDILGNYEISLVVNDGTLNSDPATTIVTVNAPPAPPPIGTIATTTGLQNLLANNSFLNRHVTAASTLYEVFEFGPVGGSMTFTFINPYGAMLRRTGVWSVADTGFPQVTESAGPRTLNSGAPTHDESLLTMTGYASNTYSLTGGDVETWLKVAPVTVSNFAGRRIESNGGPPTPVYRFAADTVNRTGTYTPDSGDTPQSFTWMIVNGRKAVLTFDNDGSTRHLYLTVRGAIGSAVREMVIVNFNSSGTVTGGSLVSWIWM